MTEAPAVPMTIEAKAAATREILQGLTLAAYEAEYGRLEGNWRALEGKAQAFIGAGGVFIGFVLAFVRDFDAKTDDATIALATTSILLLVAALWTAALALRVRSLVGAPAGRDVSKLTQDLVVLEDAEVLQRMGGFTGDRIGLWCSSNDALRKANESKAARIIISQYCLLGALGAVVILTLWFIVRAFQAPGS